MSVAEQDWTVRPRSLQPEIDLARTGPDTPGGQFMRRFWMPVHRAEDLPKGQAKPIRVMSEDFALYRGESGLAQVIDYRCPHRGAQMHLGWVEGDDIRCVYHGWKFDCAGQCIEQPAEEAGFARKVRIESYPTREYIGLIFAYFGDGEPPAFPPYPEAAGRRADREPGAADGAVQLPAMLREQHGRGACRLRPRASAARMSGIYDLPEIAAEETDWGMMRYGRARQSEVRHQPALHAELHAGDRAADGRARRRRRLAELYLAFTPVDDENQHVVHHQPRLRHRQCGRRLIGRSTREISGAAEGGRLVARLGAGGDGRSGALRRDRPSRPRAGAGFRGAGRAGPHRRPRPTSGSGGPTPRSSCGGGCMEREMRAIEDGRPPKQWTPAPAEVVPTLGF